MSAPFKYAFVLALGLAFGFCIHAPPNLGEIAKLARLDEINVIVNKAVARLKPRAAVFAVDPAGAARVTEDLDYRIAKRIGSVEGWRSFLAVHGSGVHAQTATAEVDRLLSEQASAQATAEVSNDTSLGANAASDIVRPATLSSGTKVAALNPENGVASLRHETPVSTTEVSYGASSSAKAESEAVQPALPSLGTQIAPPTPDENSKRHGDGLTQLRVGPTNDMARASKPTSGTHRTASLLKAHAKGYATICARAACFWRGRERLFAANRGRKLFTLFPLKVFSGARIASR